MHIKGMSSTIFYPLPGLKTEQLLWKSWNRVNYWDPLCLNLEDRALLSEAEQDECEPEAPLGPKTSASQNKGVLRGGGGLGVSGSSGHGNTVMRAQRSDTELNCCSLITNVWGRSSSERGESLYLLCLLRGKGLMELFPTVHVLITDHHIF